MLRGGHCRAPEVNSVGRFGGAAEHTEKQHEGRSSIAAILTSTISFTYWVPSRFPRPRLIAGGPPDTTNAARRPPSSCHRTSRATKQKSTGLEWVCQYATAMKTVMTEKLTS